MKYYYFISTIILNTLVLLSCNSQNVDIPIIPKDTTTVHVDPSYNLNLSDLRMRDPYVFVDTIRKKYYIHVNSGDNLSFTAYESKDLKKWKLLRKSFIATSDFWGKSDFWAPDLFEYHDKYYMIATFSAPGYKRGCSVFVSDSPEGTFIPLTNAPITPLDWGCLDGTLFIDNNKPYLIYCKEWLQTIDGEIYIQELNSDLKTTAGEPLLLFKASSAPWVGNISAQGVTGKVTDAPFIYKVSEKQYIMLWSSFAKRDGKYSIGVAKASSIFGPCVQNSTPLNDDDGGHAMLFKDLNGNLKISYHAPNTYPNYVSIYDLDIFNGEINIVK